MQAETIYHFVIREIKKKNLISRQEILELIKTSLTDNLSYSIVALEKNQNRQYHFHIVVAVYSKSDGIEILMKSIFPENSVFKHEEVFDTKVERNFIEYVTKSDTDCAYYNIDKSKFSWYYVLVDWVKRTPVYKDSDPFVIYHKSKGRRDLQYFHSKILADLNEH